MVNRTLKYLIFIVIIASLAIIAYSQVNSSESQQSEQVSSQETQQLGTKIGSPAPDFAASTIMGENIRLSDFRGRVTVINNFASWCAPCLLETPHLVEFYSAEDGQVMFIGLNMQEAEKEVLNYRENFDIPYPLVMDPDGRLTEIFHPIGLPTSWFIDEEGVVRYIHAGPMTVPMLVEVVNAVREGREPDVFSIAN
jgi:thiol-disulfide isomerase/thioredoxin